MEKRKTRGVAPAHVAILCGGSGSRLWPLSRAGTTKPFLPLPHGEALIAQTYRRARLLARADRVWIVTTRDLAPAVRRALPGVPASRVLAEPMGRNTAAACVLAARAIERATGGPAALLVLPADHYVPDARRFRAAARAGLARAATGEALVTFGLRIAAPKTEFGYIEAGTKALPGGTRPAKRFVEKPPAARARAFQKSGRHYWNSGIFAWRTDTFLAEMDRWAPKVARPFAAGGAIGKIYAKVPDLSIDYALMEKSRRVEVLPASFPWSDLGTWAAVWESVARQAADNVVLGSDAGNVFEGRGNLIHATGADVALFGVDGLVVVAAHGKVLVTTRAKSAELKRLLAEIPRS